MGRVVSIQNDAHWYSANEDGTATTCHEVPNKSKPGEFRKTSLADARKLALVPSVTTVLKVVPKDALTAWLIEQNIDAAITIPRLEDEPEDSWKRRIAESAREVSGKAADFGTRVHWAIEQWLTDGSGDDDPDVACAVAEYATWHNQNVAKVLYVEQPFACLGYGGTIDMICELHNGRLAVVDFKTQTPKRRANGDAAPFIAWETYGMQLRAYADAAAVFTNDIRFLATALLLNVMISSDVSDMRVECIEHTEHQHNRGLFSTGLLFWCQLKKFHPVGLDVDRAVDAMAASLKQLLTKE